MEESSFRGTGKAFTHELGYTLLKEVSPGPIMDLIPGEDGQWAVEDPILRAGRLAQYAEAVLAFRSYAGPWERDLHTILDFSITEHLPLMWVPVSSMNLCQNCIQGVQNLMTAVGPSDTVCTTIKPGASLLHGPGRLQSEAVLCDIEGCPYTTRTASAYCGSHPTLAPVRDLECLTAATPRHVHSVS